MTVDKWKWIGLKEEPKEIKIGQWYKIYADPQIHQSIDGTMVQIIEEKKNHIFRTPDGIPIKIYKVRTTSGEEISLTETFFHEKENNNGTK